MKRKKTVENNQNLTSNKEIHDWYGNEDLMKGSNDNFKIDNNDDNINNFSNTLNYPPKAATPKNNSKISSLKVKEKFVVNGRVYVQENSLESSVFNPKKQEKENLSKPNLLEWDDELGFKRRNCSADLTNDRPFSIKRRDPNSTTLGDDFCKPGKQIKRVNCNLYESEDNPFKK